MLLVKTTIKPSNIHGLGCFSDESIRAGQCVWVLNRSIDAEFQTATIPSLSESEQALLKRFGYSTKRNGAYVVILCGDNARYMNHSNSPNLLEAGNENEFNVAARHIRAGEELTCDYTKFDLDARLRISSCP